MCTLQETLCTLVGMGDLGMAGGQLTGEYQASFSGNRETISEATAGPQTSRVGKRRRCWCNRTHLL